MKVTIDEARVGKQPILKIDGIELANIVNGYPCTMTQDSPQRLNYGLHSEPIYPRLRL